MNSGIYCLYFDNPETYGLFYIGQSIDIKERMYKHLSELKSNEHSNYKLQQFYNLYGSPKLEVLQLVNNIDLLNEIEIEYIKRFNSFHCGLNLTEGGEGNIGPNNPMSLYTKETYIKIATQLAVTDKTHKDIGEILNVSSRVVDSISSCNAHAWLENEIPELYKVLKEKVGNKYSAEQLKLYVQIFDTLVDTQDRLIDIAINLGIGLRIVERISRGESHLWLKDMFPDRYAILMSKKGNRKTSARGISKYSNVVSPEGVEFEVTNAREFARVHGLTQSCVSALLRGDYKQYKGWKLV